ncbi:MAG TPA: type III pantothenate kinase [Planctomycetaceae bacterium]|nr:type III pantothenate kinase [Planctomycetaceae bacterium]
MSRDTPLSLPWMLVDIGNRRCKAVLIDPRRWDADQTLAPQTVALESDHVFWHSLPTEPIHWWIGSVHRPTLRSLQARIERLRPRDRQTVLTAADFPMEIDVAAPDGVGIDRLAAALGASASLQPGESAVVVDVGTAVTVDLVREEKEGPVFAGGAIFCGPYLAARALHEGTDALPLIEPPNVAPPPLGRDTQAAMASGLYWGLVGAVRELAERMGPGDGAKCRIVVTGGAGESLAEQLPGDVHYDGALVLRGLGMAVNASARRRQ